MPFAFFSIQVLGWLQLNNSWNSYPSPLLGMPFISIFAFEMPLKEGWCSSLLTSSKPCAKPGTIGFHYHTLLLGPIAMDGTDSMTIAATAAKAKREILRRLIFPLVLPMKRPIKCKSLRCWFVCVRCALTAAHIQLTCLSWAERLSETINLIEMPAFTLEAKKNNNNDNDGYRDLSSGGWIKGQ